MAELNRRYSYVYIMGDYDVNRLPRENDLDAFDSLSEAFREMRQVAKENDLPESHYVIVGSMVSPWEVIG